MPAQNDNATYTMKTNNNLQSIRPFPDPSFPFIINHLNMAQLPMPYIPWHWHDEFELVWVQSGTLTISTSDGSIVLQPGEGAFLNYSVLHMLKTEPNEDCDFFSIRFYSRLLFPDSTASMTLNHLNPIIHSPTLRVIHISSLDASTSGMLHLMKEIIQIYYQDSVTNQLMLLSNLYSFWAELCDYAHQHLSQMPLTNTGASDFKRVTNAIRFIAEHYSDAITLEDIANSIHLSKSECCRCFKRTISLSPIEFLIQYRVMEAIRKMQTKEAAGKSISMLSASVGFNNASYFNKQFKRVTGYTPLEYRNLMIPDVKNPLFEKDFMEILSASTEP